MTSYLFGASGPSFLIELLGCWAVKWASRYGRVTLYEAQSQMEERASVSPASWIENHKSLCLEPG